MFRSPTQAPVPVPTRKERRAAQMATLQAHAEQKARDVSLDFPKGKGMTAWVFLAIVPGHPAHFVNTVSRFPVAPEGDFPAGSELRPVAGYQAGQKVFTQGDGAKVPAKYAQMVGRVTRASQASP